MKKINEERTIYRDEVIEAQVYICQYDANFGGIR